MNSLPWYLECMNLNILLDRQVGLIVFLLKYQNVTVSSILRISFLAPLACEHFFQFHSSLPESCSFKILSPL